VPQRAQSRLSASWRVSVDWSGLGIAVGMAKALKKDSDIWRKLLGVAAVVMSDINGVRFCGARAKIDRVAEVAGCDCNGIETEPWAGLDKALLVEGAERIDALLFGVVDALRDDERMVGEEVAECLWCGPLEVALIKLPVGMKYPFLVSSALGSNFFGRVVPPPACVIHTVSKPENEER